MCRDRINSEFPLLRRLNRDLDWFFDRFMLDKPLSGADISWTPDIELFEKGDELVVKADMPGLKREDVDIQVTDSELTLKGQRRLEREENEKGYYRSERCYGSFVRIVALPDGVKAEEAKVALKDGVLEVKMPIDRVGAKTRKLEIAEAPPTENSKHAAPTTPS